jgi:peptidoglycan/xylan/chitin deacetylase (PgdA/CDA1 family)
MIFRSQLGRVRRALLNASHRRTVPLGDHGPIVTITFDDFPRTASTTGATIVERFGARATYYVAMSLMNQKNDLGDQFGYADLISLMARGHEIASHTFSHLSARRTAYDVFSKDFARGETALLETLGIRASGNFAYPYGDATFESKKNLGPRLPSSRGTCGGLNSPEVDLNLLHANSLYGGISRAAAAQKLILGNQAEKSWLIFYTHDVAAKPSPFGCTPELLEAVCAFASARARLMTVAQVIRLLEPKVSSANSSSTNSSSTKNNHSNRLEQLSYSTASTSQEISQEADRTVHT